jgi:hypothetical protein
MPGVSVIPNRNAIEPSDSPNTQSRRIRHESGVAGLLALMLLTDAEEPVKMSDITDTDARAPWDCQDGGCRKFKLRLSIYYRADIYINRDAYTWEWVIRRHERRHVKTTSLR